MEFEVIMGFKLFNNSLSLISSPKKNIFLIIKRSLISSSRFALEITRSKYSKILSLSLTSFLSIIKLRADAE